LTFDFHEIQVFTGLTKCGTHILKLDNNGLMLRKINFIDTSNVSTELVNFKELEGQNLKDFRKNYISFLKYLDEFDYKTYEPMTEKTKIVVFEGDTLTKEHLISSSDLGTRILFIDNKFESYFIRYYFCEEQLDKLIEMINKLIPKKLRQEYSIRKRCE